MTKQTRDTSSTLDAMHHAVWQIAQDAGEDYSIFLRFAAMLVAIVSTVTQSPLEDVMLVVERFAASVHVAHKRDNAAGTYDGSLPPPPSRKDAAS